ncbi:hypothetical protein DSLASN_33630 [Desulfoluna limicola]|uniref:Uncharacterized protein n=1 Tax=Desulfoluna limicola TaxID=2810562 RepID=A0ABM7PKT7_9BACT|nr:hypothetical protein [Desulfoluna limicola]BCS97731.1 hypothetical protein DSLASN_33630 [Desulfoluna limicola]
MHLTAGLRTHHKDFVEDRPVACHKEDIHELVSLFSGLTDEKTEVEIVYKGKDRTITMAGLQGLEKHAHLSWTDKLDIHISIKKIDGVVGGTTVTFYHNVINYQLRSNDAASFSETDANIRSFFNRKTPWYAGLNKVLPYLCPLLLMLMLSGQQAFSCLNDGNVPTAGAWDALTLVAMIFFVLAYLGKVFPYIWISLKSKG